MVLVSAAEPPLEEVIVPALKRTENAQDVALAVSVVSGEELEQICALGIGDLSEVIASVTGITANNVRILTLIAHRPRTVLAKQRLRR